MKMVKRLIGFSSLAVGLASNAFAAQGQGEFVPMNSLPPTEQIPAAPLLIAAYIFVWLALMAYVWSVWSRLGKVERELQTLLQKRGQSAR